MLCVSMRVSMGVCVCICMRLRVCAWCVYNSEDVCECVMQQEPAMSAAREEGLGVRYGPTCLHYDA